MSRPKVGDWLIGLALAIVVFPALHGCESTDDPEVTGLASRDYEETFTVGFSTDTLFVLIGTTEYQGEDRPANVIFDPEPVSDGLLHFRIRVVGLTLGTTQKAITGYRWSGDTLRVWCGLNAPETWGGAAKSAAADPWTPPYLVPQEVRIGPPADVVVQYLGLWFE